MRSLFFAVIALVATAAPAMAQDYYRPGPHRMVTGEVGVTMRGGARFDANDRAMLDGLAQKMLGEPPIDARDYASRMQREPHPPSRGCVQVEEVNPDGRGIFVRWRCPRGTVKKHGW